MNPTVQRHERRRAIGAEPRPHGVHFRVWAPDRRSVSVVLEGPGIETTRHALTRDASGYFAGLVEQARVGSLYRYGLDDGERYPDPASRFQPSGPHGPSQVVDPDAFAWSDDAWQGGADSGRVVYELHIGTFTGEGTLRAAIPRLEALAHLGVTTLELMPMAEFSGRFGWGYDGVDLFAPYHHYGSADDLRLFVDSAHGLGLEVILDVVYNHLGPDGNYLRPFAAAYFTDRYRNDWGESINFDGPDAGPVREFFSENAAYWIDEFHFDGLRLDATQDMHDHGEGEHILSEICQRARGAAAARRIYMVGENEQQQARLIRSADGDGYGLDALWNDDFHHTAMVALTKRSEAYYADYRGTPQELISALRWGFLFQGQHYAWQKKRRGSSAFHLPAKSFVGFLQNHDQIANGARGARVSALTSPGLLRALTALLLLGPATPMLFMGQEFAASSPFLYFADHEAELAAAVLRGRRQFMTQFPSLATDEAQAAIDDPALAATFARSKLDHTERERHPEALALHADLLALRRADPAFSVQRADRMFGAVLTPDAFALRFFCEGGDRLLLVNLGGDARLTPAPEPLLAPPQPGTRWQVAWSSEAVRYGGTGTPPIEHGEGQWHLPGTSAVVLVAGEASPRAPAA